jgi:phosphonate transport system substrate-binding protein
MTLTRLAVVAALVLSFGIANAQEDLDTIRFGIISTESTANLKQSWGPFLEAMEKGTGYKIEPFFAPDYAGVIEAMRFKKVDVAWFGNKSAMEAVDRSNGEIFVQTVDVEGNPGYWSLIVVHKDSPYESVDDIIAAGKSLKFGNGDPNSTSGFLIPSFYIWAQRGIDPVEAFAEVTNSKHEANLLAVANKKVDFATNNTESLRRMQQKNPDVASQIKPIWKSPLIPNDPFVWHKELPKETKNTIKGWILGYGRVGTEAEIKAAREVLKATSSGLAPFVDSSNHQLLPIRQLALVKDKISLQKDDSYSAEEKAKKIAEIDAELEDLGKLKTMLEAGL